MKILTMIPVLLVAVIQFANAAPVDINRVTSASYEGDVSALEAMLADSDGVSYDNAYLKYRLAIAYYSNGDSDRSDALLADTVSDLDAILKQSPDSVEANALQSTAIGMRISFSPALRGFRMGPASGRAIARALELDPNNPRAWMIKGIGAHNTPAMFGGGNKKALTALDKAIVLFEENTSSWGQADAYVWRGLTHKSDGNDAQARADFQAALTVAPNFVWAERLLHEFDKTAATQ